MYNFTLSNSAVQQASHSCPIASSDPDDRCRKMYVHRAASGSVEMSSCASCVDCIVSLLGRRTLVLRCTFLTFTGGLFVCIKLCSFFVAQRSSL